MQTNSAKALRDASPYSAAITKEQFLFYEVRTTARLLTEGLSKKDTMEKIVSENLYQYPTEKSLRQMAKTCIRRLEVLGDEELVRAIAELPSDAAKQICLYAMMKQYRLVWDFMITVIGAKYKNMDFSFGKMDLNIFMTGLQEQDDWVATWSDSTIQKIKQVLKRTLVENEYLDRMSSTRLNPVLVGSLLENAIKSHGDHLALCAFNCF